MLILAWSWLIVGFLTEGVMLWVLPRSFNAQAGQQHMQPGVLIAILLITAIILGVLTIILPAILVLFYRSRHVKATCEARHPHSCWTEGCPLPVLAVTCWLWFGALTMLAMPLSYGVMPFFGRIITGFSGAVLWLAFAALWLWLGRMLYQLRMAGWWILVLALLALSMSSIVTFSRIDIVDLYQKMGYSEAQLEIIRKQGLLTNRFFAWWMPALMLPVLGYLVWVRRFFIPTRPDKPAPPA